MIWRYHTPERDGHAPDDWVEEMPVYIRTSGMWLWSQGRNWLAGKVYRYRPLQGATVEPSFDTLKDQCLALPQDQREAIIEAMQKPQRDWADDVWKAADEACANVSVEAAAAVIRSMCLSKFDPLLTEIFDFLGSVDGSGELRDKILKLQHGALS